MATIYTVNGITIDNRYVRSHYNSTSHLEYDNRILTPEMELELDNTDLSIWDDSNPGSLLGGFGWWGSAVTVYNTETKRYEWNGVLKNIITDDKSKTIKLYSVHRIDETRQICNIDDLTGKTPAEIIYDLLVQIGIDPEYIASGGFDAAIAIQTANSVFINVQYEDDDAVEVKTVIDELCSMTQCSVCPINNLVHLYQWQAWDGSLGTRIRSNKIAPGSYSSEYKADPIYNEYYVAYQDGLNIEFATGGVDSASQATHGRKVFSIPDGAFDDDDDPADVSLLITNATGAAWVGALAVSRYSQPRKIGKLKLVDFTLEYLQLGEQLDLDFRMFSREPVKITSKGSDRSKKFIDIGFEFLNFPVERVARDTSAPAAPAWVFAYPFGSGFVLKWNAATETDYLGSKIYFTVSDNYEGEACRQGVSPVDHKPTDYTLDGYRYKIITGCAPNTLYKFRVSNYDNSFNESAPSPVATAGYAIGSGYLNRYRVDGNPFTDGIRPAEDNPFRGSPLDEWLTYEDIILPFTLSPGCVYESEVMYKRAGWSAMTWNSVGQWCKLQTRTADDPDDLEEWSDEIDATVVSTLDLDGSQFLQFRVILSPLYWTDPDYFFVRGLE